MHKRGFLVGGSDIRVHLTYQNLPGLPTITSKAATKSLGRPGDEASVGLMRMWVHGVHYYTYAFSRATETHATGSTQPQVKSMHVCAIPNLRTQVTETTTQYATFESN